MFGQYDALRIWRLAQFCATSRSVSSLTHEQFDMSKDSNCGQEVAAERIAASVSLWQDPMSRRCNRGQLSTACAMLLRFKDKVSSCGHLQKIYFSTKIDKIQKTKVYFRNLIMFHLTDILITRHFVSWRWRNLSWFIGISWMPFPSVAALTFKLFNMLQSAKAWKKGSPSCPLPKVKTSRFLTK